jgi:23S rRNA U2552 (ribose-2'-O)-methylase RlmE/FtsJ
MSSYLLPSIIHTKEFYTHIDYEFTQKQKDHTQKDHTQKDHTQVQKDPAQAQTHMQKFIINKTLQKYLNKLKAQIDECESAWDKYKKYTNPYEFIHTTVPNARNAICQYKPLSRSFFKMVEMCHMLNILPDLPTEKCKSFHLAEGPGGFIEAFVFLRKNPADIYYGMTLIEEHNQNVPGWRKSKQFLAENKNVIIEKGDDERGDLMNPRNLLHCFKYYRGNMDFITGDGGFDFSVHYLSQEIVSAPLILCQVSFAIAMQKRGGTFILKMFDTFTKISLDMLYLLANIYETVHFVKPHTSRYANSEKYVICKNFKLDETAREDIFKVLYKIILQMQVTNTLAHLDALFAHELPYYFVNKVEEYNAIFGQQQIENINNTLNLIDNNKYDRLEMIKKNNMQKCINWCQQYKLDYHSSVQPNNIFLMNRQTLNTGASTGASTGVSASISTGAI